MTAAQNETEAYIQRYGVEARAKEREQAREMCLAAGFEPRPMLIDAMVNDGMVANMNALAPEIRAAALAGIAANCRLS